LVPYIDVYAERAQICLGEESWVKAEEINQRSRKSLRRLIGAADRRTQ
jgi:hypothetical protein